MSKDENIIEIRNLTTRFGDTVIHKNLDLDIKKGEIIGIVGGSGSGKTTLLRAIICLLKPVSGVIRVFGEDVTRASPEKLLAIQKRWGVLFQQNALFSSLTVAENVAFPLKEHTTLDPESIKSLAVLKIMMAGLPSDSAIKYPSELSGGMQKRAGLARSIVLDPELLFLDEPTAGLDPETAEGFDELILNLQRTMGLTIVIVTHDLDTLWRVTNRVAFLGNQKVVCVDKLENVVKNPDPIIQQFFGGPRGQAAQCYQDERNANGN